MMNKKIILSAISGLFVLVTANSYAAQMQVSSNDVVAREASEGPRGADRVHTGTHKNSADTTMILARRGADDPVPHPRGEGVGHPNSVDVNGMILARRGADDPVPHPRGEGVGHPNSVDVNGMILARRGADDHVGSERPGEVHGQKRGGRLSDDTGSFILAREAAEGPRGADNERPGDRQRRGGRA